MTPVPSKEITAEERLRLKRYNRMISQKYRVSFNMLIQSIDTNAMYQNVISFKCEIGNLRKEWNAIREKYDSKNPAMQSQITTEFSNCLHMSRLSIGRTLIGQSLVDVPVTNVSYQKLVCSLFDKIYTLRWWNRLAHNVG